jgi:hypothetical protein
MLANVDPTVPDPRFVHCLNPLAVVPKPGKKFRPVIDLTRAGVNPHLAPWGQSLPTIREVIAMLGNDWVMAKRDWLHGYH